MTPKIEPSSLSAHNRMKAVRRSGTKAEVMLQEELTGLGLVYRVDARPLADLNRKADILFPDERVAVFVDGCFWHGCPIHGTQAKANSEFWRKKIAANKLRDMDTNRKLEENGWVVIRVWEHENPQEAASKIMNILRKMK